MRRVLGRLVRQFLRGLLWRREYRRLRRLGGIGEGRRAFLVGNGPSLAAMDLTRLDGEFVCVVNMGIRAVGRQLSHADMHVVTDANRYARFAQEIEAIARKHGIPHRFVTRRGRPAWRGLEARAAAPIWVTMHTAKLTERRDVPPLSQGVATGPSVLISAAVLLEHLGFSPIYVIGCDLDYQAGETYFYPLGALDRVHEADPTVIGRRPGMSAVDAHFAVLREAFGTRGRRIVNAGLAGNLASLPRVPFDSLFPAAASATQ